MKADFNHDKVSKQATTSECSPTRWRPPSIGLLSAHPRMLVLALLSFSFIVGTLVPVRHPFFRRLIESLNHSPGPPLLFPSHWRFGICRRHPSRFSSPGPPLLFPSHWRFGVCRRHPSRSQSLILTPLPLLIGSPACVATILLPRLQEHNQCLQALHAA